jgi:hypothetical protein
LLSRCCPNSGRMGVAVHCLIASIPCDIFGLPLGPSKSSQVGTCSSLTGLHNVHLWLLMLQWGFHQQQWGLHGHQGWWLCALLGSLLLLFLPTAQHGMVLLMRSSPQFSSADCSLSTIVVRHWLSPCGEGFSNPSPIAGLVLGLMPREVQICKCILYEFCCLIILGFGQRSASHCLCALRCVFQGPQFPCSFRFVGAVVFRAVSNLPFWIKKLYFGSYMKIYYKIDTHFTLILPSLEILVNVVESFFPSSRITEILSY